MKKKGIILCIVCCIAVFIFYGQFRGFGSSGQSVDEEIFGNLAGHYQAEEQGSPEKGDYVGAFWHLFLSDKYPDEADYLFTIYDNGAGNPGFQGEVVSLDEKHMKVKIDLDEFEQMPGSWQHEDGYIVFTYEQKKNKLYLSNHQCTVTFHKENE